MVTQGAVEPRHEGWRYKLLQSTNFDVSGIVAGVDHCFVAVPFRHILRRAYAAFSSNTAAGATDALIMRQASSNNDTFANNSDSLAVNAASGNANILEFLNLTTVDEIEELALGAMYAINVTTDNAGDAINDLILVVQIEAYPFGPA